MVLRVVTLLAVVTLVVGRNYHDQLAISEFKSPVVGTKMPGKNIYRMKFKTENRNQNLEDCAQMTLLLDAKSFDFWLNDCYINAEESTDTSLVSSYRYNYYELSSVSAAAYSSAPESFDVCIFSGNQISIHSAGKKCSATFEKYVKEFPIAEWEKLELVSTMVHTQEELEANIVAQSVSKEIKFGDKTCNMRGYLTENEETSDEVSTKEFEINCFDSKTQKSYSCLSAKYIKDSNEIHTAYLETLNAVLLNVENPWMSSQKAKYCPSGRESVQVYEIMANILGIRESWLLDMSKQPLIRNGLAKEDVSNLLIRTTLLYALTNEEYTDYWSYYSGLDYSPDYVLSEGAEALYLQKEADDKEITRHCNNLKLLKLNRFVTEVNQNMANFIENKNTAIQQNPGLSNAYNDVFTNDEVNFDKYATEMNKMPSEISLLEYAEFIIKKDALHALVFFHVLTTLTEKGGVVGAEVNRCGGEFASVLMFKDL